MIDIKQTLIKNKTTCHIFEMRYKNINILDNIADKLKQTNKLIQLNQGDYTSKDFYEISLKIMQLASLYDSIVIVEDRADIAKLIDSHGVFINKDSLNINLAKTIVGEDKIIGSDLQYANYADYVISNKPFENKITYILNSKNAQYKAIVEENNEYVI